jgi:hypothetical protein
MLLAAPALAAPAAEPARATVSVEAGELARKHTPVEFALPAGVGDKAGPLELRDERGRRLPLQVDGGQARFILPALERGKRAQFDLVDALPAPKGAPATADGVEVKQESDHLLVTVGGAPVFQFRTKAPAPTAEVPARYTRAGYLHPVFTPSGLTVTDDSPADHGHHHGVWTAWTVAEFEGRRMSFWGPEPGRSKNDLVAVGPTFSGPLAGGFTARLASTDLGVKPPKPVLDSEWKVVVHRPPGKPGQPGNKAPYFLFDLSWTDKAAGASPLNLPEYRYGGLGVRGNRAWIDATRVAFLTSEWGGSIGGREHPGALGAPGRRVARSEGQGDGEGRPGRAGAPAEPARARAGAAEPGHSLVVRVAREGGSAAHRGRQAVFGALPLRGGGRAGQPRPARAPVARLRPGAGGEGGHARVGAAAVGAGKRALRCISLTLSIWPLSIWSSTSVDIRDRFA